MSSTGFIGLWALLGVCAALVAPFLILKDIWEDRKRERAHAKKASRRLQKIYRTPTVKVGGSKMAKKKTVKKEVKKPKTKKMPVKKGN